jgi:hypothetical protein
LELTLGLGEVWCFGARHMNQADIAPLLPFFGFPEEWIEKL